MRIYLAARYSRRLELCGYADDLRRAGHVVECRWLSGSHRLSDADQAAAALVDDATSQSVPPEARRFANEDFDDLRFSHVLIFFSETPRSTPSRGGRHVEFGMAYAWGMRCLVVGPRENVFHYLRGVEHYHRWSPEILRALSEGATA